MTNARQAVSRRCELCGEERIYGNWLATKAQQPPAWVCADCQRMLILRVDDRGTPGD
jgi:hypothetical protein